MRISEVTVFPTRLPFRTTFKISRGAVGSQAEGAPHIYVRVTADDGAVGWGEARPSHRWSYETEETVVTTLRRYLGPAVVGDAAVAARSIAREHPRSGASTGDLGGRRVQRRQRRHRRCHLGRDKGRVQGLRADLRLRGGVAAGGRRNREGGSRQKRDERTPHHSPRLDREARESHAFNGGATPCGARPPPGDRRADGCRRSRPAAVFARPAAVIRRLEADVTCILFAHRLPVC